MISYIAVAFFCIGADCYFWSGHTLHASESVCHQELSKFVNEAEKAGIESAYQCIKVPLREA
jgi:hypothetical protein